MGELITHEQRDLARAYGHVQRLLNESARTQRIYGGLCHRLPILILTDRLAPTVAFIADKASGTSERARAYALLAGHLAEALGLEEQDWTPDGLMRRVREAPLARYIADGRALLRASVFYKRFAVAVLHVESTDQDDEERTG